MEAANSWKQLKIVLSNYTRRYCLAISCEICCWVYFSANLEYLESRNKFRVRHEEHAIAWHQVAGWYLSQLKSRKTTLVRESTVEAIVRPRISDIN